MKVVETFILHPLSAPPIVHHASRRTEPAADAEAPAAPVLRCARPAVAWRKRTIEENG